MISYEVNQSTNGIKCMKKNFNGYVLFGKLFCESSGNVTLLKKRFRLHDANEKGSIHIVVGL